MNVGDELFYRLSRKDVIIEVGGHWDRFAIANDGASLISDQVVGQSIFAHVLGEPTRDYVWTVLDGVRKLQRPVTQTYRCDSPKLKRFMEMTIEPEGLGNLCLRHRLVSTEPLALPVQLKAAVGRRGPMQLTLRCSICNRLRVDGLWHEPEHAVESSESKLRTERGILRVAYTVCPTCQSQPHLRKDGATHVGTLQYHGLERVPR